MKYKANTRRKAIEYEKDLVRYWKEHKTFEKSVEQRPKDNSYVFYDGPPFITGVPHVGTLLATTAKDVVPRYWTMQGKRVERVWGWDCHGLPAEVFTEKKLGIQDRRDIGTKVSLEDYINTCRANMVATGNLWEDTIDRIGRWVDFKGAYKTMDKEYMESVWWAFQQLYDKGKIYEGEKVLLYCTRDATPLSKAEVTMDSGSYKDVTDPSVYVKFKLTDESAKDLQQVHGLSAVQGSSEAAQGAVQAVPRVSSAAADTAMRQEGQQVSSLATEQAVPSVCLLAWTTTPWTLPANTAVAVNKDFDYAEVEVGGERLIIATELLAKVLTDEKHQPLEFTLVKTYKGSDLVGRSYEPLFADRGPEAHKVWAADYVTLEDGTGIVHLAPAYGEEDYLLSKEKGFPFVSVIDENGFYSEGPWQGQNVWEANKPIAKALHESGEVWKVDYIVHSYPHCYRCGTRLMYRAHPSWFMDIDDQRTEMLVENNNVNWFPAHIKHGRFEKTVQSAPDWNLSRDRFWATAMPVWKGKDNNGVEKIRVVGSYKELEELSGVTLDDYHRPWVDDVTFTIDGIEYKRIDKVMDCWFESGSMPFAQFHYPFENVEKFEQNFPGDFIVEYVGQVRAWFYYVHAVNVALFGHNAYKNVITTGTLMGNDGRKLSKSLGNYTDPNELMDLYSADALRFFLMSSPVMNGEDATLKDKDVQDVQRKLAMVWNMYDFFTMYAEVDKWQWNGQLDDPLADCTNPLDSWIVSRVHQLVAEVEKHMDSYDLPNALKPIVPFIEDASNWYVRRSRRRFWRSSKGTAGAGDDADKDMAYRTLHYVLVRLSYVMAPFTPFLADELYQKLTGGESVHLQDWLPAGHVDELVVEEMSEVREYVTQALALRAQQGIKVRQPLALLSVPKLGTFVDSAEILRDEVNVKQVERGTSLELDMTLTPALRREGMAREVIRNVQMARKKAGLSIDDRIELVLRTDNAELKDAIDDHAAIICSETLAGSALAHRLEQPVLSEDVKIDGHVLSISLQKA